MMAGCQQCENTSTCFSIGFFIKIVIKKIIGLLLYKDIFSQCRFMFLKHLRGLKVFEIFGFNP